MPLKVSFKHLAGTEMKVEKIPSHSNVSEIKKVSQKKKKKVFAKSSNNMLRTMLVILPSVIVSMSSILMS